MPDAARLDLGRIAQDLQIRKVQVEGAVQLLDEGNTVPFIARYRKDRTAGLDEGDIRLIQRRVALQRQLAERKQTLLKNIQTQGKLTDELQAAILAADTNRRLDDLYLPYKPKKRSPAMLAREHGLEPLALAIWNKDPAVANLAELLPTFVNPEKELHTPEVVLAGAQQILAELVAEIADVREAARRIMWETGKLTTAKAENLPDGQGLEYKDYFEFTEPVQQIPPHRILAINRGEKEGALRVRIEWHAERLEDAIQSHLPLAEHPHADYLKTCMREAIQCLIAPSLEREIRRELTDEAEDHAVQVFTRNLQCLLLQSPLRGQRVLAIDPGFRSGCRLAVLDEHGNLLEHGVIHPHPLPARRENRREAKKAEAKAEAAGPHLQAPPAADAAAVNPPTMQSLAAAEGVTAVAAVEPAITTPAAVLTPSTPLAVTDQPEVIAAETAAPAHDSPAPSIVSSPDKREEAKAALEELVRKHQVNVVAIGNGTACRETEELVSELIAERLPDLVYVIVNEAGASHYSASAVGREEFPDLEAGVRGTISIGRRLQDPLHELVKIDPQNIGVGLYQHDISPKRLKESLEAVIESCVNQVGVDLNTASVPLLRHISGLNPFTARAMVDYRKQHGPFKTRDQLQQVPGLTPAACMQAAGFLRVGGDEPLDNTWIHPESYPVARGLLEQAGCGPDILTDAARLPELRHKLRELATEAVSQQFQISTHALRDVAEALSQPGRDPRDDLPKPIFRKGILKLEELQPGMELKGTVLNVVDFGAFVDVGLKDSGLVHISQLANRFIKSPYHVVSVGDVVTVWVLKVDQERRRVSLTMIQPGSERKRRDRKPRPARPRQGPPRGQRPALQQARPGQQPQPAVAATAQAARELQPAVATATSAPAHRARLPQRPSHPPRRERPKPKLSEEALQGAQPLRTFAELKALYEAKKPQ